MALKKTNSWLLPVIAVMVLLLSQQSAFATGITLTRNSERTIASFAETMAFDEISVPAISTEIWGKGKRCIAAAMQLADHHFVASIASDATDLIFSIPGIIGNSIILTPLLLADTATSSNSGIKFSGVLLQIKQIEEDLNFKFAEILTFQRQNQCFSCHTALPLALACKVAAARGYRVDYDKVTQFSESIRQMQHANGTFSFPSHPDYGIIATTLCAGAVLAMLSDFNSCADSLKKILAWLPAWLDKDGLPRSDFYFRPLFVGQTTAALLETIIVSTIYFRSAGESDHHLFEQLRERLLYLQSWGRSLANQPIHNKILLMAGMPYLFQFKSDERPAVIKELQSLLSNEPEGKRPDIRSLARFILGKIDPANRIISVSGRPPQNTGEKIWLLFEQIISFSPITDKKNNQPADKKP